MNRSNKKKVEESGKLLSGIELIDKLFKAEIEERILITPIINLKEQLGYCSFDVRLGTEFMLYEKNIYTYLDPMISLSERDKEKTFRMHKKVSPLKPFVLHPGDQVLGCTLEYIRFPPNIFAQLSGRSTWSRQGLAVHLTAEFVHPNTKGMLTFELQNNGPVPIKLYVGMRVAQLCFYRGDEEYCKELTLRKPKYENDYRTHFGKIWDEYEFDVIKSLKRDLYEKEFNKKLSSYLQDLSSERKQKLTEEIVKIAWNIFFQSEKI